jgi:hypothetical protein
VGSRWIVHYSFPVILEAAPERLIFFAFFNNKRYAILPLLRMRKIYLAALLIICISQSCRQKETLTREEVMAAIQRFDTGWKNKNSKMVDSVLSPSYIYFTQSGGIFDRKNVVHTAGSVDYMLDTVQRQQFDIKIEGNTAVVNTLWRAKGSYFGTPFNDSQRCSVTLIKNNGKVEILSEHCTPIK